MAKPPKQSCCMNGPLTHTRRDIWLTVAKFAAAAALASALAWVLTHPQTQQPAPKTNIAQSAPVDEAQAIVQEAYVYLYPLILMDLTRKQFINFDPKVNAFGVEDREAVHKVPDGYKMTQLVDWGKKARPIKQKMDPSVDTLRQVNEMPAVEYFKYGAELMQQNPPHATDWSTVERMKRIGVEQGKGFDTSKVSADVLAQGAAAGLKLMRDDGPD